MCFVELIVFSTKSSEIMSVNTASESTTAYKINKIMVIFLFFSGHFQDWKTYLHVYLKS
jgi:hypothetical protein